jgi:hypothetical protein
VTKIERDNGWIEDGEDAGNSTFLVTVEGTHLMDADMLDRTLQFVLVELGVDTAWQVPPPDPEVVPPPVSGPPDESGAPPGEDLIVVT